MPSFSVIATIACFAYAIESIFGFGGTIIFLGISGLIYDFGSLLKLAMIVGLSSGLAVLMQSFKYLSVKHLGTILIYTMPGALIGTMMITYLASGLLIKLFSIISQPHTRDSLLTIARFFEYLDNITDGKRPSKPETDIIE